MRMNNINILVADDDKTFCRLVKGILDKEGYKVVIALDVEEAKAKSKHQFFDIIMLDMCFPALSDGFGLLDEFIQNTPESVILMISGSGHIPDAVQAVKNGAKDFIEKPISAFEILQRIQDMSVKIAQRRPNPCQNRNPSIGMVGNSPSMAKILQSITKAASFDSPVLISGETGVGKELVAHAIHRLSKSATKPMVSINCASVPQELFEAELFGYEQGAFTGAVKSQMGYFEFAKDSSIFLDEVIELPMAMQAKLLRVISEGEIQKLGGKMQETNARIISATNQDLELAVKNGIFRSDLLYRLNTVHIHIPPLRERPEDIPELAKCFVQDFCKRNKIEVKNISPNSMTWLQQHNWPGNVRQLRNSVERALIFSSSDTLQIGDFNQNKELLRTNALLNCNTSLKTALLQFEKNYIDYHFKKQGYSLTATAEALALDKSNLSRKLKQHNISKPE